MPQYMGMNPLLDQYLFYHGSDKAVNSFVGQKISVQKISIDRIEKP
jgi:hypothetical protein